MKKEIKDAIENYQCPGCVSGSDISCFEKRDEEGEGCDKHVAGTSLSGYGAFFLGMPTGFCRTRNMENFKPRIFEVFDEDMYNKFNIPTWKHLNKNGHTLVRGLRPRINEPFLHIFLENCIDKIECLEITEDDIKGMD